MISSTNSLGLVKRAIRALESEAYRKASAKTNSKLPSVTNKYEATETLKLLAINQLAFQVNKIDTEVAVYLNKKPRPGVPCLEIEHDQVFGDDHYVCWFYDPLSPMTHLYSVATFAGVFALILFPLWPLYMRTLAWHLSSLCIGLVGSFFGIAIARLVIFVLTYYTLHPGIWLFPNLFEDIGIVASFKPVWGWHGKDSMKMHRPPKKRISKRKQQEKAKKLKINEDLKQAQAEATTSLQTGIEAINAQLEATAKRREEEGNAMTPAEMSQLGQELFEKMMKEYEEQLKQEEEKNPQPVRPRNIDIETKPDGLPSPDSNGFIMVEKDI